VAQIGWIEALAAEEEAEPQIGREERPIFGLCASQRTNVILPPAAAQFAVTQADRFVERLNLDRAIRVKMPEALSHLALSDPSVRR
jgi:hypothetical protein